MRRIFVTALGLGLAAGAAGCDGLFALFLASTQTSVRLVNNSSDRAIQVTVWYSNDSNDSKDEIMATGTRLDYTIQSGQFQLVSRNCSDIKSFVVRAELDVGGSGPQNETNALREGSDFECGQTLILTYDHSPLLIDFHVTLTKA